MITPYTQKNNYIDIKIVIFNRNTKIDRKSEKMII